MYKIDLHTHSSDSPDGGIRPHQYAQLVEDGILDAVAITDHNTIDLAVELHHKLGQHIIIGEEIGTAQGEIIGLFLTKHVKPGQSALATAQAIKNQGGLVYIPHPFETIRRHGITKADLERVVDYVDIMEVHNGRAIFQRIGPQAVAWATMHHVAKAVSSDAHGVKGIGHTYTMVNELPSADRLVAMLNDHARFIIKRPPYRTLLYPKAHRLRRKMGFA